MAKTCIGCKREISSGQKTCYLCGCSQSYFRYHLKSGLFVLILVGAFSSAGYWYLDKTIASIELEKSDLSQSNNEAALIQVEQLALELEQAKQKVLDAEANLLKANEENNQLTTQLEQASIKITEAENKTIETEKKAGWLLKLNRDLKQQVSALSTKAAAADTEILNDDEAPSESVNP